MEQAALRNVAPPQHARRFFTYVAVVVGLAVVALGVAAFTGALSSGSLSGAFWLVALLAVLVDTKPFSSGGRRDRTPVFPSVCYTFVILLAWGFGPAVVVQTVAVAIGALWLRHAPWRAVFNAAQYVLAFAAAAWTLHLAGVAPGDRIDGRSVSWMVVAAAVWFTINNLLVATAVWLRFGGRWWPVFTRAVRFDALSTGALLLSGPGIIAALRESLWLALLSLVPLYAVARMASLAADRARAARLDPLTGLSNRAALERAVAGRLAEHADRAAGGAPERRLALLLLDLDGFKKVNDALG